MPTITLNGKTFETPDHQTILEVARARGVYVPSLCYHPKTGQAASCRICAVEVEGARGLVMACHTQVWDGMVIHTDTPQVLEARRLIVDLLLSDGTHDCLSCEVCGRCELQEAAYRLGIERPSERVDGPLLPLDLSHPMIARNPNKCIHCFRCIVGCNDVVVNGVLDMAFRGHGSMVVADQGAPLGESSCVGCGECVQLCPTGALVEKKTMELGRTWNPEVVQTTCPYCGVGCQMHLHVDRQRNRVVRVTGVEGAPPNDGMLCVKGRFAFDFPASPKRLTQPLLRRNGALEPVSWDEALDYTAQRLREIRDVYGPDAISGISSSRDNNENSYAAQKFMRGVLGTNNIDNCART
jgi:formate dehydrogenase major subunit